MPGDELLDEHLLVVSARELDRGRELRLVVHLRDADRRAEARGLDEDRVAERVLDRVAEPDRVVRGDGDAAVAHHLLEQVLVHRERGGRDAGADVGDVRELEQPLHRPVLAERAVQDRQDDVDGPERRERPALGRNRQRLRWTPSRCLAQDVARAQRSRAPSGRRGRSRPRRRRTAPGRARQHRARGRERDVVLARAAAREQGDAEAAAGLKGSWSSSSSAAWWPRRVQADHDRHRRSCGRLRAAGRVLRLDDVRPGSRRVAEVTAG